ncbi:MAG: sugar kinase [Saprospiraceae bacterium]
MSKRRERPIDILCAGELLVDLISRDYASTFDEVSNFEPIQGGSPANLCMNMARLGNRAKLVASVGNDDMGRFMKKLVESHGVDCTHLVNVDEPTTLVLVTKSQYVANFEAYRGADCLIKKSQLPTNLLRDCSLYHTTCFALSRRPAQKTILRAAKKAAARGCQVSIDANYAKKIWPNQTEAQNIVDEYCNLGAIVKVSEVDWERLYGSPLEDPKEVAAHFLDLGANIVCVTMGGEGSFTASADESHFLQARKIDVKDTTGAGDAFWSGFLTAWLDGHNLLDCTKAGRRMAEIKISSPAPLPKLMDRSMIYADL